MNELQQAVRALAKESPEMIQDAARNLMRAAAAGESWAIQELARLTTLSDLTDSQGSGVDGHGRT